LVTEGFEDRFQGEEKVLTWRRLFVGGLGFEKMRVATQNMIFSV
jgi:hypothetical protein